MSRNDEMGEPKQPPLMLGLSFPRSQDAAHVMDAARADGYDFVTTTLPQTMEPRSDVTNLESEVWRNDIVGRMDTLSPAQMEWAYHMGIPAVILPEIPQDEQEKRNYYRNIVTMCLKASHSDTQLWVRTKLSETSLAAFDDLCRLCDGSANLGMMLVMESLTDAPDNDPDNQAPFVAKYIVLLHKAIGSQVKAVCYPCTIFLTNKKGFPTLSKFHQNLFTELIRRLGRTIQVVLEGPTQHPEVAAGGRTRCLPYQQYIRHLRERPEFTNLLDTDVAKIELDYLDQLVRPTQPLVDNLDFSTYELTERDSIKYQEYERAIGMALQDIAKSNNMITVLVAGAGRGMIVTAALSAMDRLSVLSQCKVYCVEKNKSTIGYLKSLARNDATWKNRVKVIHADMRRLKNASFGGAQADIVISELLGSFGDDDLSPECLDGLYATGACKENAVFIPSQYSSYLAPLSSMVLHSQARAQAYVATSPADGLDSASFGSQCAMETPYQVRTHGACQTHVEKLCWSFSHPNKDDASRQRVAELKFEPDPLHGAGCGPGYGPYDNNMARLAQASPVTKSGSVTIHGFVGTFDALLYKNNAGEEVRISTCPQKFTQGIFSWHPFFFPLKEPLLVPSNMTLTCSIWRGTDVSEGRVWYEWGARVTDAQGQTVGITPIHNPNGRSYSMKL